MSLDERLAQTGELVLEWHSLRGQLEGYGYTHAADFIASCTARIAAHLHTRRWPPIWWRYMSVDAELSALTTYFFRMDSEGMFYGDGPDGYRPERDEILERVQKLSAMDKEHRRMRQGKGKHAPADI